MMFYHLYVFNLLLIVCNSQDHLTCVRTDQVLRISSSAPTRGQQGFPGKRGPIGLKGDIGAKGSKGEPGIPDNSPINELREEINRLRRQVEINTNNITKNGDQLWNSLNGWVTLNNGHQYKLTPQRQTWDASRSICQQWGGDLVVYGVQSMESRRLLRQILSISSGFWIGLNDQATEGRWVWVNGEVATAQTTLWYSSEPNNFGSGQDCGMNHIDNQGYDISCNRAYPAVCEK